MTSSDHYFSAQPESRSKQRSIQISLAGRSVDVVTAGGVFSPEHLDRGTEILLTRTPPAEDGPVLDLGCGWGPIALSSALDLPGTAVWAVDVNERELDLTRTNADRLGLTNVHAVTPDDVPDDLTFAEIRSNPPIRVGKAMLHTILETWLTRLVPVGVAYLVVSKHLGAESLQRWVGDTFGYLEVDRLARDKGFHVIRARRLPQDER